MGGTTGKLTHFGVGKEVIFGTAVGATAYLPYTSESIVTNIEPIIPASLLARHWEGNNLEGLNTVAGDSVHEVHPAGIGYILRSALRSPETTDNTGSYTHVYQPPTGRAILSDTAQATTSGTEIVLTAIATDDIYNGCWCHIKTGTAADQWVIITDTVASTNKISVVTSPACVAGDTLEIMVGPEHCAKPPYTLEVHRDLTGTTPAFRYAGCCVNSLSFAFSATDRILKATPSWLGKTPSNIANTTPSLPTTNPFVWTDAIFGVGLANSGTASGGSTTTLVDTGIGWTANQYQNDIVLTTGGTGANQCRKIASHTTDTITPSPNFTVAPDATTTYKIFNATNLVTDMSWNWANGLVATPTSSNTREIYKIEQDTFVTGGISKTIIPEQITDYSTYFTGWSSREWCIWCHGPQITGNHYYEMIFYFPRVLFMTYPINVGGPGGIRVATDLKIEYDSTATYAVKTIIQNNTSAY